MTDYVTIDVDPFVLNASQVQDYGQLEYNPLTVMTEEVAEVGNQYQFNFTTTAVDACIKKCFDDVLHIDKITEDATNMLCDLLFHTKEHRTNGVTFDKSKAKMEKENVKKLFQENGEFYKKLFNAHAIHPSYKQAITKLFRCQIKGVNLSNVPVSMFFTVRFAQNTPGVTAQTYDHVKTTGAEYTLSLTGKVKTWEELRAKTAANIEKINAAFNIWSASTNSKDKSEFLNDTSVQLEVTENGKTVEKQVKVAVQEINRVTYQLQNCDARLQKILDVNNNYLTYLNYDDSNQSAMKSLTDSNGVYIQYIKDLVGTFEEYRVILTPQTESFVPPSGPETKQ